MAGETVKTRKCIFACDAPQNSAQNPFQAASVTESGVNPGKHGLFDFVFPRNGSYEVMVANPKLRDAEPMWSIASRYGKKVAIVSVPMTYPPEPVNGLMLSCFMTPNAESDVAPSDWITNMIALAQARALRKLSPEN